MKRPACRIADSVVVCCSRSPLRPNDVCFVIFFRLLPLVVPTRSSFLSICPNPHIPYKNNKKQLPCRPISTTSSPRSAHPYSAPSPTPLPPVWAQNTSDDVFEVLPSLPIIPSSQTHSPNSLFSTRISRKILLLVGTAESSHQ